MNPSHECRREAEERRLKTYHSVAAADIDHERGGRHSGVSRPQVIGSKPMLRYPQQPEGSPFRRDPVGSAPTIHATDPPLPTGRFGKLGDQ